MLRHGLEFPKSDGFQTMFVWCYRGLPTLGKTIYLEKGNQFFHHFSGKSGNRRTRDQERTEKNVTMHINNATISRVISSIMLSIAAGILKEWLG